MSSRGYQAYHGGMDQLRTAINSAFQRSVAYDAYLLWRASGDQQDLNTAVTAALPLVRKAMRKYHKRTIEAEELQSVATAALFDALRTPEPEFDTEAELPRYLITKMKAAIMRTLRAEKFKHVFDYEFGCTRLPVGRVQQKRDMEFKIFLEQLPKAINDYYHTHTRLKGTYRHAGDRILIWILRGHSIIPQFVSQHFHIKKSEVTFIVDYVVVMIRKCLMEIKSTNHYVIEDWHDLYELYTPEIMIEREETYDDDPYEPQHSWVVGYSGW